jgi:hypothetical protein
MLTTFANMLSRAFCRHHNILKADGRILYVACMKCGKGSNGIDFPSLW